MENFILAINPGSTSTKIALYDGPKEVFTKTINHNADDLAMYTNILDQYDLRKKTIIEELENYSIDLNTIKIIVGRGGLLRPIKSGVYIINDDMKKDLIKGAEATNHASNLGGLIAEELSQSIDGSRAFIADPPVVDEMEEIAHVAGHPDFKRKPIFHALNQKAVARRHAKEISKDYKDCRFIVAHLGGGISVGAHKNGMIIDVNNALDGEGPFSPERSGSLPVGDVVKLCFKGKHKIQDIKRMLVGNGGLRAHLGTSDVPEILDRIENGDDKAKLIFDAMLYQIAKSIGAMYAVLQCEVDAIIITGGLAHNSYVIDYFIDTVGKMTDIEVYPGENEMESLALNGWLVLNNEISPIEY